MNEIGSFPPFFPNWHAPCNVWGIERMTRSSDQKGEFIMFANSELANRLLAAFSALAITTGLLVASFALPAATIATTVVA